MREIVKLGYRRPGLVLSSGVNYEIRAQWLGAFEAAIAMEENSLIVRVPPYLHSGVITKDVKKWIKVNPPDVLISNEWDLEPLLKELHQPIPVATLDWVPRYGHLSGIDQIHEFIGSASVDLLTAQVYRNERGVPAHPKHMLIEGVWRHGESCPPV